MKRLLTVLVLTMVVLAVVAAPVYAKGGPVFAPHHPAHVAHHATLAAALPGTTAHVVVIRGRGVAIGLTPVNDSGTGVAIAAALVLVIGGIAYAIVADRRQLKPAAAAAKAAQFPDYSAGTDQRGEAA